MECVFQTILSLTPADSSTVPKVKCALVEKPWTKARES